MYLHNYVIMSHYIRKTPRMRNRGAAARGLALSWESIVHLITQNNPLYAHVCNDVPLQLED